MNGNVTIETVDVQPAIRTTLKTTTRSGLPKAEAETRVNGLTIRKVDFDGLISNMSYDSLLRPKVATDSRGNTTTTGYYSGANLKEWVKDGTNQTVASFGYDTSGRVVWQADALNNLIRTSYTATGQIHRQ